MVFLFFFFELRQKKVKKKESSETEKGEGRIERWERKREGESIKLPVAHGWEGRASRASGALKKEEKGV